MAAILGDLLDDAHFFGPIQRLQKEYWELRDTNTYTNMHIHISTKASLHLRTNVRQKTEYALYLNSHHHRILL